MRLAHPLLGEPSVAEIGQCVRVGLLADLDADHAPGMSSIGGWMPPQIRESALCSAASR